MMAGEVGSVQWPVPIDRARDACLALCSALGVCTGGSGMVLVFALMELAIW